ncbi:MAG TPA: hypothetical protein VIY51_25400 [Xanthobacteraceae bacterium]
MLVFQPDVLLDQLQASVHHHTTSMSRCCQIPAWRRHWRYSSLHGAPRNPMFGDLAGQNFGEPTALATEGRVLWVIGSHGSPRLKRVATTPAGVGRPADGTGTKNLMQPSSSPTTSDGVTYARTREGFDLPVIDVTSPRFAVPDDPAMVRGCHEAYMAGERRRRRIPKFIMGMMLRSAARKSRLVRAMFNPNEGFLDGISTYVMKLGADNLVPPYDTPMDRRVAAAPHVVLVRLRMQQVAHLIAEEIVDDLAAAAATAPLSLINIGGGPALDSINALILLRRARPDLLNRRIAIEVLDVSPDGAFFGANALAALRADNGPLAGLDIAMQHRDYDWNRPAALASLVEERSSAGAVIAASSEGALFEYGSDQAIVSNLQALRAEGRGVRLVAGSVTCADETRRRMIAQMRFKLVPRGIAGFAPLAAQAGFRVAKVESALISDQVLLRLDRRG